MRVECPVQRAVGVQARKADTLIGEFAADHIRSDVFREHFS